MGNPDPAPFCFAKFANLEDGGNLSLVVGVNDRIGCEVSIIDKSQTGFTIYGLGDGPPEIRKLPNGNPSVVVYRRFTQYQGAMHCVAEWPVVWSWTSSGYSYVGNQSEAVYQDELKKLEQELAAATDDTDEASGQQETPAQQPTSNPPSPPIPPQASDQQPGNDRFTITYSKLPSSPQPLATPNPLDGSADCVRAEAAKIKRSLGDPDAGMSDAIKWADSDNSYDRAFAADLFADIGTPEAVADLKTLSHDSNTGIAGYAKALLPHVGNRPSLPVAWVNHVPISRLGPPR